MQCMIPRDRLGSGIGVAQMQKIIWAMLVLISLWLSPQSAAARPLIFAQQVFAQQADQQKPAESPEEKMKRRFPQKVRVGDLIGLPMLDDNDVTLGLVQKIVRTPTGKIRLIVSYSKYFGWFGRPVAVPIEVVAILARQIASIDMPPEDYVSAPTWSQGNDKTMSENEIIRIALTRR